MAAGKVRAWSNSHARSNFFLFSPDRETNKNGEGKETKKEKGKETWACHLDSEKGVSLAKDLFP